MRKICIGITLFISSLCQAQNLTINKVEVAGDKVNLYYDLLDTDVSRTYTVNLFSSKDNFISPLQKAKGDVGLEVKPGGNKVISWSAREELGNDYDGEVALEIRGRVYIPFVRLDGLQIVFRRGVPHELTWTGGTQQNILNFDLYEGEHKVTSFPNIANVGHYTITLPFATKPGNNYYFKITDSKNKDQIVNSQAFRVKRKVPLFLKMAPLVLVGSAVYLLMPEKPDDKSIKEPLVIDDYIND